MPTDRVARRLLLAILAPASGVPLASASEESRLHVQFNEAIVSFLDGDYPAALKVFSSLSEQLATIGELAIKRAKKR